MSGLNYNRIDTTSVNTPYTGSISKAYVTASGTITNVIWGDPKANPMRHVSQSVFENNNLGTSSVIVLEKGQTLEGPIGRLRTGTAGLILYQS